MKEMNLCTLRCLIKYPEHFTESKKYPLLIFLHGAGTRGNDIRLLKDAPFFQMVGVQENFPFVVIAPQCGEDTWFDCWEHLKDLAREAAALPFVDASRVYLMGASMGGYATWQLAMSMPETFAAIVPICGGGMYWNAGRLVNVPVWAFHGKQDNVVFVEESIKMVDSVNRSGGQAKLTVYPENDHDAWTDTYTNPEVFTWFLQQENKNVQDICDQYDNAAVYG